MLLKNKLYRYKGVSFCISHKLVSDVLLFPDISFTRNHSVELNSSIILLFKTGMWASFALNNKSQFCIACMGKVRFIFKLSFAVTCAAGELGFVQTTVCPQARVETMKALLIILFATEANMNQRLHSCPRKQAPLEYATGI